MSQSNHPGDELDTINGFALVGDFGFNHLEGPFSFTMDGGRWEVAVPTDQDDYAAPNEVALSALKRTEVGTAILALADGEPVVGGRVVAVDEIEHDVLIAADAYPMGSDGQ